MTISIDNVFMVLNFSVVCIGAVYLVRRYGVLYILSSIREQKQKQDTAHREYDNYLKECAIVKLQADEQEYAFMKMKEKFHLWQMQIQQKDIAKQALLFGYDEELQKKQAKKLQNLQQKQVIQRQLPLLLKEISDAMQTKFQQNSPLQKDYTASLVKFIKEREL